VGAAPPAGVWPSLPPAPASPPFRCPPWAFGPSPGPSGWHSVQLACGPAFHAGFAACPVVVPSWWQALTPQVRLSLTIQTMTSVRASTWSAKMSFCV